MKIFGQKWGRAEILFFADVIYERPLNILTTQLEADGPSLVIAKEIKKNKKERLTNSDPSPPP